MRSCWDDCTLCRLQLTCKSVTSRTVGTVGLLSRFSVLQFAARCCVCPAVIWSPDSSRYQVLQPPLDSGQAALNVRWRKLASRLLSTLLHTSPCRCSRVFAPISYWVFLEMHWTSTQVAVHEDCDLVNMFLSSKSHRRFGFPNQIPRCTFQRNEVKFMRLAHSLGQMFRCFSKIQSVLGQV